MFPRHLRSNFVCQGQRKITFRSRGNSAQIGRARRPCREAGGIDTRRQGKSGCHQNGDTFWGRRREFEISAASAVLDAHVWNTGASNGAPRNRISTHPRSQMHFGLSPLDAREEALLRSSSGARVVFTRGPKRTLYGRVRAAAGSECGRQLQLRARIAKPMPQSENWVLFGIKRERSALIGCHRGREASIPRFPKASPLTH